MSHALRILPEAEAEILRAANWYESRRTGLGVDFIAAIDHALTRIAKHPAASPYWRQGYPYRRHVIRRFPYVVFFTSSGKAVEVTAVAHVKRKPGYWMSRAPS